MSRDATKKLKKLEAFLVDNGFSGNIKINHGAKNSHAVRRLMKSDPFYTFGLHAVHEAVKRKQLSTGLVREIMVKDSGLTIKRFLHRGSGYFEPTKSALALEKAMIELKQAAKAKKHIAFATGHPGAMTGLLQVLADWAESKGAKVVRIERSLQVDGRFYLDQIGSVLVPSDNCSAWHSHETHYLNRLLEQQIIDMVVGDHGFVGSALNHAIPSIGFYDTDDPAMPVAAFLDLPVTAVPINDNRYNANSAALGRFILENIV